MPQRKRKVIVTQEDISLGRRASFLRCPMSLALNRQYPEDAPWGTGITAAWQSQQVAASGGVRQSGGPRWRLSSPAMRWIKQYDGDPRARAAPITFWIMREDEEEKKAS